jgi:hypothetical protein
MTTDQTFPTIRLLVLRQTRRTIFGGNQGGISPLSANIFFVMSVFVVSGFWRVRFDCVRRAEGAVARAQVRARSAANRRSRLPRASECVGEPLAFRAKYRFTTSCHALYISSKFPPRGNRTPPKAFTKVSFKPTKVWSSENFGRQLWLTSKIRQIPVAG